MNREQHLAALSIAHADKLHAEEVLKAQQAVHKVAPDPSDAHTTAHAALDVLLDAERRAHHHLLEAIKLV